ncbi:hypothetical protein GQ55_5G128500 [Panicum hallii var. hallii]|uniref:Subtilisin-like protease fibronectin type-III domain-containing protein n=1 Tax=Panicum hallii var. hallii TaxID=1504633 RepID=A0A2T7DFQ6_9POAL|nr:hypothetical protein GQ55_5G128500 [Panicum hallii var. hallii]
MITVWGSARGAGAGSSATVLAAIDDAIHDGVDVLSLSLVVVENSFGALQAVQKGITIVYAAGNFGPAPQVVQNTAPWVITVAASKIDRSFPTAIMLGNKQHIVGQSLYYEGKNLSGSTFRLLADGGLCTADALNGTDVRGKIVLCVAFPVSPLALFPLALKNVLDGGGSGIIFAQYSMNVLDATADCKGIPCVLVDFDTANQIGNYMGDASSPVAKIEPARTVTGAEALAPTVAAFSSRGPSINYPEVIKPDIAAPGVSILSAKEDEYALGSGTSMATPHVAGIVALLKALHPNWSPAALRSAIMTTKSAGSKQHLPPIHVEPLQHFVSTFIEFCMVEASGGYINPNKAAEPGLVYEIDPSGYNKFIGCTFKKFISCNKTMLPGYHLNLPSIAIPDLRHPITVLRTVTNIGEVDAVYHAEIQSPPGVNVDVEPSVLSFNAASKVMTFQVKLSPLWRLQGGYTFGSLTWQNGQNTVRIPIAARIIIHDFFADVA